VDAKHVGDNEVEVAGHDARDAARATSPAPAGDELLREDARRRAARRTTPHGDNTVPGVVRSHAYLGSHRDYVIDIGQDCLDRAPRGARRRAGIEGAGAVPRGRCRALASS
jgi:hypothetical protein